MDNKPTNKKIYYNLDIIWHNIAVFYSGLFGIVILVIVGLLGYWVANKQTGSLAEHNVKLSDMIRYHEQELLSIQQQLNYVRVELEVEKVANQSIQEDLHKYKLQNAELKKELTFYQNVMAPEMNAEGVILENFIIEPTLSEQRFRYKVTLVQTKKQKPYAKGHIKLVVKGNEDNKPKQYDLDQLGLLDESSTQFSFRYFQVLEGEVELPKAFQPERVELAVVLPKGRWQKYSRLDAEFDWQPGVVSVE